MSSSTTTGSRKPRPRWPIRRQAEVPVITIAMDAGFQSLGPFNRAFKATTGVTPTEYRRLKAARPDRFAARLLSLCPSGIKSTARRNLTTAVRFVDAGPRCCAGYLSGIPRRIVPNISPAIFACCI